MALLPPPRLLAAARVLAGLTQAMLAKEAGIGVATVRRYEGGVGMMRVDTLAAAVEALRKHGVYLLPETDEVEMGVFIKKGSLNTKA